MEEYIQMPSLDSLSEAGSECLNEVLPAFDFSSFVNEITKGKNFFEPNEIINTLLNIFAKEMYAAIKILTVIMAVVMISSILENLRASFGKSGTINSAVVSLSLIIGFATKIFAQSCDYATGIAEDITKVMWALLPVMTTLLAGGGYTFTGIAAHPILYFMCNVFAEIFTGVLIPLTVTYLVISLVDTIADSIELGKLRELIKKVYNFVLGFIMTLFTGLLGISSFTGVSLDSVGAKGAKFALSNMVPFVGRSISDAMGAVASASLLLKNAVGITGVICMIGLCIIPIIKTAAVIVSVRIGTAVCEPIADSKTIQALTAIADSLSMINAAVISTVVMMIISLSIIVGIK